MMDEDVENKKGIYAYVLTRKERFLNIRAFSDNQKREAYERQQGICSKCGVKFELNEMEGDHITPWHEGGKTTAKNCQMLCKFDNRSKSGKWKVKSEKWKMKRAPSVFYLKNKD